MEEKRADSDTETPNFKVGDIVKLKSGGESMTIHHIEDDLYECRWFSGKNLKGAKFKLQELVEGTSPYLTICINADDAKL